LDALESHLRRQIEHSRDFFWHRLRWTALAGYLPAERAFQIADVGAGAGLLGELMSRERPAGRYRFVEPIASLETYLEQRYGAEANLRSSGPFTGIGHVALLDVLEHQEDDRAFLRGLAARMEPGSTLLLTVPALMGLWSGWDKALGHCRRYDKASLRACFDGLPFRVRELSYLFPELIAPALWRRLRTGQDEPAAGATEFPDLPPAVNQALYRLGRLPLALRRWAPLGTSLFAVLDRAG
jgi:hypothetical protein